MKFGSTVLMLASILIAVAVPIFFGHGLATEEGRGKWFGAAAACLLIASALIFVQRRIGADDVSHH